MRRYLFLFGLMFLLQNAFSQSYVKYFLNDNEIRILAEKSLKKITDAETLTGFFYEENALIGFANKKKTVKMAIFIKEKTNIEEYMMHSWLANSNDNVKVNLDRVDEDKTIIERQTEMFYEAVLLTSYQDGLIEVRFRSPVEKKKKWSHIVRDMFNSVEIKSR